MPPTLSAGGTAKSPVQGMDGALRTAVAGAAPAVAVAAISAGDQWWPWPLVISLYSSTVGFATWLSLP